MDSKNEWYGILEIVIEKKILPIIGWKKKYKKDFRTQRKQTVEVYLAGATQRKQTVEVYLAFITQPWSNLDNTTEKEHFTCCMVEFLLVTFSDQIHGTLEGRRPTNKVHTFQSPQHREGEGQNVDLEE